MTLKRMSAKEFRELGYLQELNRQFLHPLGLALMISIDDAGNEKFSDVWDAREDNEGIRFDYLNPDFTSAEDLQQARKNAEFINEEQAKRSLPRDEAIGFWVEPLEESS